MTRFERFERCVGGLHLLNKVRLHRKETARASHNVRCLKPSGYAQALSMLVAAHNPENANKLAKPQDTNAVLHVADHQTNVEKQNSGITPSVSPAGKPNEDPGYTMMVDSRSTARWHLSKAMGGQQAICRQGTKEGRPQRKPIAQSSPSPGCWAKKLQNGCGILALLLQFLAGLLTQCRVTPMRSCEEVKVLGLFHLMAMRPQWAATQCGPQAKQTTLSPSTPHH